MNPDLQRLEPYPFERLAQLFADVTPPADKHPIRLSLGEPRHTTPGFIAEVLLEHLHGLAKYPLTRGSDELREAIAAWLQQRFALPAIDPASQVLPVNGTREALFAIAQCLVDRSSAPVVMMPNPFYQIYEGAALLAGAEPYFLNTTRATGYLPDLATVPADILERAQLIYVCTPGNPSGAVMPLEQLQQLVELADRHDFVIASDECYSEIYHEGETPPPGLLQAAAAMGRTDFRRCLVFHSLSKRSNAPGLRSGFVAGDAVLVRDFLRYRTYHGCAMPPPTQAASVRAWQDERHVIENRRLYTRKFDRVLEVLGPHLDVQRPQAGFYLWPRTPVSDTRFAHDLQNTQHVTVLPGSFLSRDTATGNPGSDHVRMALVAPEEDCLEAAGRIRQYILDL